MRSGYAYPWFFLLCIICATAIVSATSVANPASGLHLAMRDLCSGITGSLPTVSMFMVLAGGAIYASGQIMGAETRSKANVWAVAALTGAVIGGVTTAVTPGVLQAIYGADVNCAASGAHGSFSFCGTGVGELCCTPDNTCNLGMLCDATGHCSDKCGNAPGGDCCPRQWCGNAAGLFCDPSTSKCSPLCGSRTQPCCDKDSSCQPGLGCSGSDTCQGCGNNGEDCCKSGAQCNVSAIPRLSCGVSGGCQPCGAIVGSLCCPSAPYCAAISSACNSTSGYCESCGLASQLCCAAPSASCSQPNHSCQSGICGHCGQENESCCPLAAPNDCDNSSMLRPLACKGGTCKYSPPVCGGNAEPCCQPNNNCSAGFDCNMALHQCLPCGAANSQCCPSNPGPECPTSPTNLAPSPSLFCNLSNSCQACGGTDKHCCYNSTSAAYDICTSAGAICNASAFCQHTGDANEPCSITGDCNTGFTCVGSGPTPVCLACGGVGQDCCSGTGAAQCPTGTSTQPLYCNSLGKCQSCGADSQTCCVAANSTPANTICNSPSACNATNFCSTCGILGAGCCATAPNCTVSNSLCNYTASNPACVSCGSAGLPCCYNSTSALYNNCTAAGTACNTTASPPFHICYSCGGTGQQCCGSSCTGARTCLSSLCYANCTLGAPITTQCACGGALRTANSGYCSMSNKFNATLPSCSPLAAIANNDPLLTEAPCVCNSTVQPPVPVPAANGKYCCNGAIQSTSCTPTCTPGALIGSTSCICEGAVRAANSGFCSITNKYRATLSACSGPITSGNNPATNETPCTCGTPSAIYASGTCCANTYTSTATTCCADGGTGTCKCGTNPALCTTSQYCSLSATPNNCVSNCTANAAISGYCNCGGQIKNTGYCVNNVWTATLPGCSTGAVPSSGCLCGSSPVFSGYCCLGTYSPSECSFSATGGTITTSGSYKIHTFTASGTFTVIGNGTVQVLVVGGGGGGGFGRSAGGGGGGGYQYVGSYAVSAQSYAVTVGNGGNGATGSLYAANLRGANGGSSSFGTITALGGGGGGSPYLSRGAQVSGSSGGCGGGSAELGTAGTGSQGYDGGNGHLGGSVDNGGGGGGAGQAGHDGDGFANGVGGNGLSNSISGASITYAGGGGGGSDGGSVVSVGGTGGGGKGGGTISSSPYNILPTSGTNGLGGGGGGGGYQGLHQQVFSTGGNGGSGIVIIRYVG